MGWCQRSDPIQLALYADTLQTLRLAAQGKRPGRQPPDELRERVATWFDPLPFWALPLEERLEDAHEYPLHAITQRPMAMYHSWDSQNAWLRQLHSHNALHVHPATARAAGVEDGAACWVESRWGRMRCRIRCSEAVEPGTVWTWNAIGKAPGAWQLPAGADESRKGFILFVLLAFKLPVLLLALCWAGVWSKTCTTRPWLETGQAPGLPTLFGPSVPAPGRGPAHGCGPQPTWLQSRVFFLQATTRERVDVRLA
jgi:anaerobic selenocysteine-containing dehydrogenase